MLTLTLALISLGLLFPYTLSAHCIPFPTPSFSSNDPSLDSLTAPRLHLVHTIFPSMLLPHPHQACVPPSCIPKSIPPSNTPFHLSSLTSHCPYSHNLRTITVCIHPSTCYSLLSACHPLHYSTQALPPSRSLLCSQSSSLPIILFLHLSNLRIPSDHPTSPSIHPSSQPEPPPSPIATLTPSTHITPLIPTSYTIFPPPSNTHFPT